MTVPKFRVWEPYYKKMFANDQIIVWNGNVYVNDIDKITVDNIRGWSTNDKYLMQSTGLKDRNGVEIFEGDVVSLNGSLYTVAYDKENGAYKMISHDERWIDDYILSYITTESLTIAGNKFEGLKE